MVDFTAHRETRMSDTTLDDETEELELSETRESSERVKKVVIASVLASLSIAVAPIAEILPRIPGWGIALFDPVSLFWIVSFLLGGLWVGIVSMVSGTLGLFLYDPTAIGPVMKLLATLPMIVVPWYGVYRLRNGVGGETLSRPRLYVTLMLVAFVLRLAIMIPVNLIYGAIVIPFFTVEFIISYALILNTFQSFWDALIPFIIVHPTGIFKNFKLW